MDLDLLRTYKAIAETGSTIAAAARLGLSIPPELRHTAMGDAEATAEAFLRLIPALQAKGLGGLDAIRAEARRHRRLIADANDQPLASNSPGSSSSGRSAPGK